MKFSFKELKKKNQIALLIDPEKINDLCELTVLLKQCEKSYVDFLFVGGSTCSRLQFQKIVLHTKSNSILPIILFPGSPHQLSPEADALLFLSLVSGRNPYYLIESQIEAALEIKEMDLKVLPTSYILVQGDSMTSVELVSNTTPIESSNVNLIYKTALAGHYLGHKATYLDAGSGAKNSISLEIVKSVSTIDTLLIVGGGIRSINQIREFHNSGVHITVIGNHIEKNPNFLSEIASYKNSLKNE